MTTKSSGKPTALNLDSIDAQFANHAKDVDDSTARYFAFKKSGMVSFTTRAVCFNSIAENVKVDGGFCISFQGYGGFRNGDRWRTPNDEDLLACHEYPFVQKDGGHYNEVSLEWLKFLLHPDGPFKSLLPLLYETDPVQVQDRRGFIFPDTSLIPARLTWCFAIASRLGFANARTLWRYLKLQELGVDFKTAALVASGFEHEIKNGKPTGGIIKSYTAGFLGVDTTAYAGRFLTSNPIIDPPFSEKKVGTYGSSEVFKSGKIDMGNLRFKTWDEAIEYTQKRGREQTETLKLAA